MTTIALILFCFGSFESLAQTLKTEPSIRFLSTFNSSKLGSDQLYVIDADVPILVFASPKGMVNITEDAGPIKIRSKFLEGSKIETKTFKGKQVFVIEAIGKGNVEILVVPTGKPSDTLRKTIEVEAQNPVPPPVPDVPTEDVTLKDLGIKLDALASALGLLDKRVAALEKNPPVPVPDPPTPAPKVDSLTIVVVWESEKSTQTVSNVMKDLPFWRSLEPLGVQWFQFDQNQPIVTKNNYMKHAPASGVPFILYMNKEGRVIQSVAVDTKEKIRSTVKDLLGK